MIERIAVSTAAGLLAAGLLAGCAARESQTSLPQPRPLGAQHADVGQREQTGAGNLQDTEPTGIVDLEQALPAVLTRSPGPQLGKQT